MGLAVIIWLEVGFLEGLAVGLLVVVEVDVLVEDYSLEQKQQR